MLHRDGARGSAVSGAVLLPGEEEECLCKIRALTGDQVCGTDLDRIRVMLLLWYSNTSKVVWVCFFLKLSFLAKEKVSNGGIIYWWDPGLRNVLDYLMF